MVILPLLVQREPECLLIGSRQKRAIAERVGISHQMVCHWRKRYLQQGLAICNAVRVRINSLPITPEKMLQALEEKKNNILHDASIGVSLKENKEKNDLKAKEAVNVSVE